MKDYQEQLETLQKWIDESKNIVFFGGAGVSTESGIPDFRSVDGLYNQQYKYSPETILSRSFFDRDPEEFYRFYRNKMLCLTAKPNAAHKKLAQLEAAGKLKSIVTQNIDGLHQAAGSKRVWELHGSVLRNRCMACGRDDPVSALADSQGAPRRHHQARRGPLRGEPQLSGAPGGAERHPAGGHAYHRGHLPGGLSRRRAGELLPGTPPGAHQQVHHSL
mgnify:CR=1 FL=1